MAVERPLEGTSDAELFKEAVTLPPEPAGAELEPEPKPEPVITEPPKPEPKAEVRPTPEPEATIPSWRLREEAEARRQAEERARALEGRLQEIATHLQQQQKQPDFFDNPDQATQRLIQQYMQPYAEQTRQTLMQLSKMVAGTRHGDDKVEEAEQAFLKARAEQTLDIADYEKVVTAPNRYDAVVQWHKRQSVLSSVGDDPAAWFERQLEAKMADPAFQGKLLEKIQGGAATRPSLTKLPPSLSRSTAAKGNDDATGDMSDSSLFAFATKR